MTRVGVAPGPQKRPGRRCGSHPVDSVAGVDAAQVPPPPPAAAVTARPAQPHLPGFPAPPPGRRAEGDERIWLSYSRIATYRRCPLQYRYSYVERLPQPPAPARSFGSAIHKALEVWWGAKLPDAPPVEVLLQALYDSWEPDGFAGMPREEQVRWYRFAQDVLRRHHRRHAPAYEPAVAAEQWFQLELGGDLVLSGIVDHVARTPGGGLGVVDWKTDRTLRARSTVARDLQLACYALAARELWGIEPEWVALDFVVPGIRVTVPRDAIDTDAVLTAARRVGDRVAEGRFEPTPGAVCAWCDYRTICPAFAGDGPDVLGLALEELTAVRRRLRRDSRRAEELEAAVGRARAALPSAEDSLG